MLELKHDGEGKDPGCKKHEISKFKLVWHKTGFFNFSLNIITSIVFYFFIFRLSMGCWCDSQAGLHC
jgi:hypothetical protein